MKTIIVRCDECLEDFPVDSIQHPHCDVNENLCDNCFSMHVSECPDCQDWEDEN